MALTVCTAEQRAGQGHPLRRPAAPARGAAAQPEPRHRPLRVRQHQGSCQVTHGPATAPPGAEEPAPGEEAETSLKGTRKKKCICAAQPARARHPSLKTLLIHSHLGGCAMQGRARCPSCPARARSSHPEGQQPPRVQDQGPVLGSSASCEPCGADGSVRTLCTPNSARTGHWNLPCSADP